MTQRAHRHTRRSMAVPAALAATVLAACVPPGAGPEEDAPAGLEVSFAPEPTQPAQPSPTVDSSPAPASPGTRPSVPSDATAETTGNDDGTASTDPPSTPAPTRTADATIADASGDVEPGRLAMDPPEHADLVGATLTQPRSDTLTLRIDLLGGAPAHARDDRHTMNVASFYDVDGDGSIDFEVWANLSSTGWGTSQFDNDAPSAGYGADDDVSVEVVDGQLVLTFPASAVGGASTFRWALAAEWGTYEDLQLGTMSRDLAPDDHQPARFPG